MKYILKIKNKTNNPDAGWTEYYEIDLESEICTLLASRKVNPKRWVKAPGELVQNYWEHFINWEYWSSSISLGRWEMDVLTRGELFLELL